MTHLRAVLGGAGQVLAWLVILGIASLVTLAVVLPRVGGATPYAILSGSMRPALPTGSMVVVRPTPAEDVRVGDVVTYQRESGRPEVVTHRVVSVGVSGTGERVFRTRGDANDVADAGWVRGVQLKGVRWYDVPYLGRVTHVLDDGQRQAVVTASAGLLFLYAAAMVAAEVRERRRGAAVEEVAG